MHVIWHPLPVAHASSASLSSDVLSTFSSAKVELMHTFSFVFLLFWQACSTAKRFGQTSAQESFDDRSWVEGSWRPTKSRLDSLHDPPARYCRFHFRVLYVMTVYLIFLQSLTSCCFDAPSPHPQWKKRNHKKIALQPVLLKATKCD